MTRTGRARRGALLGRGERGVRQVRVDADVVREGETIDIRVQGQTYRFLIKSLEPRNIVLEPLKLEEQGQAQEDKKKERT